MDGKIDNVSISPTVALLVTHPDIPKAMAFPLPDSMMVAPMPFFIIDEMYHLFGSFYCDSARPGAMKVILFAPSLEDIPSDFDTQIYSGGSTVHIGSITGTTDDIQFGEGSKYIEQIYFSCVKQRYD